MGVGECVGFELLDKMDGGDGGKGENRGEGVGGIPCPSTTPKSLLYLIFSQFFYQKFLVSFKTMLLSSFLYIEN